MTNVFNLPSHKGKLAFTLATLLLAYCAKTIPVEELSRAKYDINRAEAVRAEKYANEPYTQARQALVEAHDAVEKEDMDLAKKKAEEASAKAKEAYAIAAPQLAQDTRTVADTSIRNAEEANAEAFAPVEFRNATAAFAAGDGHLAKQEYMESIQKFEEAREEANKALGIAEGQIEGMRRQAMEIEDKIQEAERMGAKEYAPDTLRSANESLTLAKQHIAEKKLKLAVEDLAKANEQASLALKISQKEWARRKYVEAEAAVQAAESNMIKLRALAEKSENKKALQESQDAQDALTAAEDTLEAAKESLRRAENEYKGENYVASYNHSEEAIRLAKIVNEQIPNVELAFVQARASQAQETETKKSEEKVSDTPTTETREGWKKYKVRLIPHRRDCLWRIAEYKFIYGNPYLWPKIYRANKSQIKNPDLIYPGQVFDIPPKDWKGEESPKQEKATQTKPKTGKTEKKETPKVEPKKEEKPSVETIDEYQRPVIPEDEYEEE